MASKLTTLAQQHSALDYEFLSRKSIAWLQDKVRGIKNPTEIGKSISRERERTRGKWVRGGLYFFQYDPKLKQTLPYYDIFPLVIMLEKYNDGFLGLNLHYLPIMYRAAFLDKLSAYANFDDEGNVERLKITYDILKATKGFKAFKPCLKRYLVGHMMTKPLKVEASEWETALFLPVERFKKQIKSKVQADSIKQINSNQQNS